MRSVHFMFEEFFEAEKDRLLRVLSLITGSSSEAEDLAQEAFTRVFERWDMVATMEDPAGYLHRTAMNLFRSQYRRAARGLKGAIGRVSDPGCLPTHRGPRRRGKDARRPHAPAEGEVHTV